MSISLKSIPPGAQRRVHLTAILTSYATYDLSEVSISHDVVPGTEARTTIPALGVTRVEASSVAVRRRIKLPSVEHETALRTNNVPE